MFLNKNNIIDMIKGSTILGTGGGGSQNKLAHLMRKYRKINLIDINRLNDDEIICTAFMVGSISSDEKDISAIEAKNELENLISGKISAIIPVEIGPGSIIEALILANDLNLPLIDSDVVGGRSTPEVYFELITLYDIKREPLIAINCRNEKMTITKENSYIETETKLREFSKKSDGLALVIGYPMKVFDVKNILNTKTLTKSMNIGSAVKKSRKSNNICSILKETGGIEIIEGVVTEVQKEDKNGFLTGYILVKNNKDIVKIWFKNENIVCWLNDKPVVACPDIVSIIYKENYEGISNRDIKNGMTVSVIAIPAIEQ